MSDPHPIWPEGPDCDEQCPGKGSQYHYGFAWGVEKERARIRAEVEGLPMFASIEQYVLAVLAIIDREDTDGG